MAEPKLIHTTDASFETEVLRVGAPAVVDFWAQWSGPSKAISPLIAEFAERYGAEVKVAMLNVDENPQTPSTYGIKTLPTLVLFRGGEAIERVVGAASRPEIEALFESALNPEDT